MKRAWSALLLLPLLACSSHYSPDTYNAAAVQQAAKVDRGIVVGVRTVAVSANATTGAVTGGAAGGIVGSQVGGGVTGAFGALGGTVIGGLVGAGIQHGTADALAYEYIVRKASGEMVSVTQQDKPPLAIGQKVLVIAGPQARIVADYTAESEPVAQPPATPPSAGAAPPAVTSDEVLHAVPPTDVAPKPAAPAAAPPAALQL